MQNKGIPFILIATLSFAVMNIIAKYLSDFHPMQVVFFRAFGTFIFIFPAMLYHGVSIKGKNPKMLLLRGVLGLLSLSTFFIALQRIPIGSAVSIRYMGPIFAALMAFFFLKEKIKLFQWLSFLLALAGVFVLKGFDERIDLISLGLILFSALTVGAVFVMVRFLATKENYMTIINYFMITCMVGGLLFLKYWRMPVGIEWLFVSSIGVFGCIGQIFMTKALEQEEASVLAPFKYMELVYAIIMGFFFFGESYTILSAMGIALIMLGMIGNVWAKKVGT